MAWGKGALGSCDALLKRVEDNDPKLTELVILPMKTFGTAELEKLSCAIESGANTNLQSISASGHHLPPASLKRFGIALSTQAKNAEQSNGKKCGISSLAIGSKDMGDEGVIALCEGLKESNGGLLQIIDFGWKNLGKDSLQAIGRTFASSKCLTHLDLSRNNDIGNEGIACLANAAKENVGNVAFPSLEKLNLSECNIGPLGVQSLAEVILGPNNNRSKPIDLAISSNPIGSESCGTLSTLCAIPGGGSIISRLQLSKCSIGDDGIKLLSVAAMSNSCIGLTFLDLAENSISKKGAKMFAESLAESWPDLVELKLAKNELDGEGVAMVMGALISRSESTDEESAGKKNSTLENLDLSCTNCGIEGAKAALMSGGLSTIRMFNNRLGSDGFHSISSLLQGGHPSIENLDLGGNDAGEDAVVALLNSIAVKEEDGIASSLSVLEIGGNKFGDEAQEALNKLKCAWPQLDVAHDKPIQEAEDEEEAEEEEEAAT
eukprot:CAMPEP_0172313780 /NCGR_PEP_ID=MMETSP1058-20130122/20936_1 /TAXON_ID=83371 /ORGANISM="Detonula confervacea, Strain CCMP 353" /LENGTH=491 /DNA_ID=CAMNT_0013027489 /DNA_START=76 /DNA_END=1548 /DNA_ORIENTATION=+